VKIIEPGSMIEHVDNVCRFACASKLSDELFESANTDLQFISSAFDLTLIQSVIFCCIIGLNLRSESVSMDDMLRFVECSPMAIFSLQKEFDALVQKQLIKIYHEGSRRRVRQRAKLNIVEYYINDIVLEMSILHEEKFVPSNTSIVPDVFMLFQSFNASFRTLLDDYCTIQDLSDEIQALLTHNHHLQFVQDLNKEMLDIENTILFLSICTEFLDDQSNEYNIPKIISCLYKNDLRKQMKIRQTILLGTNPLITKELITIESGSFRTDNLGSLTERAIYMLVPEMDFSTPKSKHDRNQSVIYANQIVEKRLYFDDELQKQLDFLLDALQPSNFTNLVERMSEAGIRTGIAILMHGLPGTGKSESVLQIARQTGRDLHPVNISETKNKYFGESEKLIQRIFNNYRASVERSEITPILFLDECDGVLTTRTKVIDAVNQTQNSSQNILLKEMSDLKGIMICTTNNIDNLDKAFERRFLFKIHFDKTTLLAKKSIWLDKIKSLTELEAMNLAQEFDLSGGQIENVSRKYMMSVILKDQQPNFSEILEYCQEESLYRIKETRKIGYLQ
jgi:ATPase family associated with various cellular activities (AAA)